MKTILSLITICFVLISVHAQEFKFEKETINYGKITQGSDGKRVFEFTNVGDTPLIISRVQSVCGCTIPKKPETPIMPGEKGQIEVSYDTKRLGSFSKRITIISNAKKGNAVVKIKGVVAKNVTGAD